MTTTTTTILYATCIRVEEEGGVRQTLSLVESSDIENPQCLRSAMPKYPSHEDTMSADMEQASPSTISPVSVALEPFWKSTVSVDEAGAEVTLHEDGKSLYRKIESVLTPSKSTPVKQLDFDQSMVENSLIDVALISPASPDTPVKAPFCGLYACFPSEDGSNNSRSAGDDHFRLHGCILTSLGSCEDGSSWQRMLPDQSDDELDEENVPYHNSRVMHNRTMHGRNKSDRLDRLRQNLHPFNASKAPLQVNRATTFSGASRPKESRRSQPRTQPDVDPATPTKLGWHWACNPTISPVKQRQLAEVDQNACYDSDPEEYQVRTHSRGPPSVVSEDKYSIMAATQDEHAMQELIQGMFKERWTLIMHPERGTPVGIEAWLERGQRLYHATLPPKMVWIPLHDKHSKKTKRARLGGVDLLDIQRILQVGRVNRSSYPFAKPRRTFLIKSLTGDYCLEARSMADRDRLVQQLKLTVARFGSQLVSNDPGVEDFFVPLSHGKAVEPEDGI